MQRLLPPVRNRLLDALPVTARPAALRMRQMSTSTYQVAAPRGGMLGAQAVAMLGYYLNLLDENRPLREYVKNPRKSFGYLDRYLSKRRETPRKE